VADKHRRRSRPESFGSRDDRVEFHYSSLSSGVARNCFDPDGKERGRLSRKGSVGRRIEVGHGPSQVGLAPSLHSRPEFRAQTTVRFLLSTRMARMQIKMLPQRPCDYPEFSRSRTQPQRWSSLRSPDRCRDASVASRPLPRRFGMKRPGKGSLLAADLAAGSASSSGGRPSRPIFDLGCDGSSPCRRPSLSLGFQLIGPWLCSYQKIARCII
jgi:hypothetical protein